MKYFFLILSSFGLIGGILNLVEGFILMSFQQPYEGAFALGLVMFFVNGFIFVFSLVCIKES